MNGPMNWNDTAKAAALSILAERTTTAVGISFDTPRSWKAHDLWLSRVKLPCEQATPTPQGTALRN